MRSTLKTQLGSYTSASQKMGMWKRRLCNRPSTCSLLSRLCYVTCNWWAIMLMKCSFIEQWALVIFPEDLRAYKTWKTPVLMVWLARPLSHQSFLLLSLSLYCWLLYILSSNSVNLGLMKAIFSCEFNR